MLWTEETLPGTVVEEMNCLLWAKPRMNRGTFDSGWSCREHTAVTGALLKLAGRDISVVSGNAMFVQGARDGRRATGLGVEPHSPIQHWWLVDSGDGAFDLSPQLDIVHSHWRPLSDSKGIFGGEWQIDGLSVDTRFCHDKASYASAIEEAANRPDMGRAVYWPRAREPFKPDALSNPRTQINSPATSRILQVGGSLAYLKLICHLTQLREHGRGVGHLSQNKAWRIINDDTPNETALNCLEELRRLDQEP